MLDKDEPVPPRSVPLSLPETRHVLHELQVQQIELEMQNEELRRAQRELDAAHLRYFELYDIAPVAYCSLDVQGVITHANLTAAAQLGCARSELLQQRLSRFIVPDDQDSFYLLHRKLLQNREPMSCELRLLRGDGTHYWAHLVAMAAFDEGVTVCRLVWSDVSHSKVAEQALAASVTEFATVLDTTQDGYWRVDAQGRLLDANPAYCRKSGYTRDELIGKHVSDLEARESAEETALHIRRLIECGHGQFESQHRRKDGSIWWAEVSTTYSPAGGGQFFAFIRNISARREAEARLRVAAIAFESQESMMVTDARGAILRVNRAFTEITGYGAQEVLGRNPRLLRSGRHDAGFYRALWGSVALLGSWSGEVWNRRKSGEIFPEWVTITAVRDEAGHAAHYVCAATDMTLRKDAEDQIRNLAFYDPLTHLPNRRLLLDRLAMALASGARNARRGALLFVDLDHFKMLNDTLGHVSGDLLLEQVARRLCACVREGDTVARLGGDEFVVMLGDLSENEVEAATQAETTGGQILDSLNRVYQLGQHSHHSTPSIGVTLFGGERQENVEEPLKRADLAMYQAKAAGRNTLRFFDPQMQAVVIARATLELELREALEQHRFVLHYQAQVAGHPEKVTGVEALVRWVHPQRGLLSPGEFIPLAEETGVILPLGQMVLELACAQLAEWAGLAELAQLTIAVNVSARQFHQDDFVERVLGALQQAGANPQRLKLELTESVLVANVEQTTAKMNVLKALGVGFSLDDFGTGYSSLSYLKRLPLDQLKIDQGFVRDILSDGNDAAIARMVIVLAESLGLTVIAEGVETAAQRDFLASQGCHAYQGFLFARPLPSAEFEQYLKAL
jgi:diguanylate cyclase (GGDEF)-like protein/PAS domain S-box-containing protein